MHTLDNLLFSLKNNDLTREELVLVGCNLCSLGDLLSSNLRDQLMIASKNLLCRAILKGTIHAMWNLKSTSFFVK